MVRTCKTCGILAECYPGRRECKRCTAERVTRYQRENKELRKKWTASAAEKNRERVRRWRLENPERRHAEPHRCHIIVVSGQWTGEVPVGIVVGKCVK